MQRYKIIHRTYYNYTSDVALGAHQLLLRPREDHNLRIESFVLKTTPSATLYWHRDVENNSVAIASFDASTSQLMVESEVIIQQYNEAPLDFIMADHAITYPFAYVENDEVMLLPYRMLPEQESIDLLNTWIYNFYQTGESIQTYALLKRMCEYIYQTMTYQAREEPGVQSIKETLLRKTGSCRDFASLFMEGVKCLGMASRFVSGYLYAPLMSDMVGSTHAWAEVYLPGAGWTGFDPTIGKIVGGDHIAVAVARLPESVPPIAGSFTGSAKSTLDVGVWVSQC
jgi:transglutaminase-like putative cysteine protease